MADTTLSEGGPQRTRPPARSDRAHGLRRGTTLARYIVIDRLGGGGMGDVYSAWDEELRRRVALKVIRPRAGTDARERMLAEARALARLRHPHIVAVHDAGEATLGDDAESLVYVAMEHLDGVPATAWSEGERSAAERMSVVLHCAKGLAAAHERELVHRDVKPSNVVVETREAGAWAMLVDFGLAATQDDASAIAGGTRAYMAPECLAGAPADARADQWSLALMAAELLGGTRPSHEDALAGRLGSCGPAAPALRRALAEDPAARFPDVSSFASALRRAAGRRRRRAWTVGAGLTVALGSGALATAPSREEAPSCAQQADAARNLNAPPAQVQDALAQLRAASPEVAASVGAATQRWVERWTRQHAEACDMPQDQRRDDRERCLGHEATQVMALLTVGAEDTTAQGRWQVLGALARAVEADACAHATADPLRTTPALARAVALETASRLDEAFEVAHQEHEEHDAETPPSLRARTLHRLASIERRRGHLEESLRFGEEAMRWAARDDARTWAKALDVRVETQIGRGDYERALEAVRLARATVAAAGDPPDLLSYWHYSRGRALGGLSRFPEALEAHREALAIREQTGAHTLYLADSHRAMGNISMRMADCAGALPHLRNAIDLYAQSLGPGSPSECYALSSVAQCEAQSGDFEAALSTSRRASTQLATVLGDDSIEVAKLLTMEGQLLGSHGDYAASLVPFRRAAEIRVAALGPDHPETLVAETNLGWLLLTVGQTEEAAALLLALIERVDQPDGPQHPNPGTLLGAVSALHVAQDRPALALDYATRALALAEASPAASNPLTLTTPMFNLAEITEAAGDTAAARALYVRVWGILDPHPAGAQQPTWAPTNLALGRLSTGVQRDAYFDAAVSASPDLAAQVEALRRGEAP